MWICPGFGKNVILTYLGSGEDVYAYEFNGYWKMLVRLSHFGKYGYLNQKNALDQPPPVEKIYSRSDFSYF